MSVPGQIGDPGGNVNIDLLSHLAPDESGLRLKALRKKLTRRAIPDHSQLLRRSFQLAFLLLNIWLGAAFYLWVRGLETGAVRRDFTRPAGIEGWLPIAGLMNLKYWLATGRMPTTHPAALCLLMTFVAIAYLFRKSFCSWLCPVGTLSEYLWRAGRKIFGRNFHLTRWVDIPLRSIKYLLLAFFVWAVASMPAEDINQFMHSPYGAIADVRLLNFFRHLSQTAAITLAVLALVSLIVQNFWCRYLCPYGALLGLVSLLSPLRIRRFTPACVDCAKCAKACPSSLPVDKLITIKSAECTGCLECVTACPAQSGLQVALPHWARAHHRGRVPAWAVAVGIAILFFGIVTFVKTAGYWDGDVPNYVYRQLVPQAAAHPGE
jgi:polyferredoxin